MWPGLLFILAIITLCVVGLFFECDCPACSGEEL